MAKLFDDLISQSNVGQLNNPVRGMFNDIVTSFKIPEITLPLQGEEIKKKVDTAGVLKPIGSFIKTAALSPAKFAVSAGITVSNAVSKMLGLNPVFDKFVPEGKAQKLFWGEDPIMAIGKNREGDVLKLFGQSHEVAEKYSFPIALAFGALDTYFPSGRKVVSELLISQLSKKYGDDIAHSIANTNNLKFVQTALTDNGDDIVKNFVNAVDEVSMELTYSIPGQRIFLESGEVIGAPSTFPKWVPENLKKTDLFQRVLTKTAIGQIPKGVNEKELYDLMQDRIKQLSGIPEADIAQLKQVTKMSPEEEAVYLKSIEADIAKKTEKKAATLPGKEIVSEGTLLPPPLEPPIMRGGISPPLMDFTQWKEIHPIRMARETLERNIDTIAGKDAQKLQSFLVERIRSNETNRVKFVNLLRNEIRENIVNKLGITAKSIDDSLIMKFGEERITLDELKKATPKWQQIQEATILFRSKYDELLDTINTERSRFGYEPIPKRKDYFRHFQEVGSFIDNFGMIFRNEDLPADIAGLTKFFKPGKPFTTAELKRMGTKTVESAIEGFDNYLDSVSRQISHIDSLQRIRSVEKYIRDAAEAGQANLPNTARFFQEYGNLLSGKAAEIDRSAEGLLGRGVFRFLDALKKRTGANMILGNIGAALTNFIPFTQTLATTQKKAFAKGLLYSVASGFKKFSNSVDGIESSFLIRRFPDKTIDPRGFKKIEEFGAWLFVTVDKFTARAIVSGKYFENISNGMNPLKAMDLADDYAGKVMADRSIGGLPNLMNTKLLGPLTQFQTEINNFFSFLIKDIPNMSQGSKSKAVQKFAELAIYSWMFNEAYEKVTGRRVTLDPVEAMLDLTGMRDETEGLSLTQRARTVSRDILGNLPFTGGILEGRFPVAAGVPSLSNIMSGKTSLTEELKKPAFFLLPPLGGLQIKKTVEGAKSILDKEVKTPKGTTAFEIETTPLNIIKGGLFGKYAFKEARKYFDDKTSLLGLLQEQDRKRLDLRLQAEEYREDFKSMSKDEKGELWQQLSKEKPEITELITEILKEEEKGLTYSDRLIKQLNVQNGARAKFVFTELQRLETSEERRTYWKELAKKGLISDTVKDQLEYLINTKGFEKESFINKLDFDFFKKAEAATEDYVNELEQQKETVAKEIKTEEIEQEKAEAKSIEKFVIPKENEKFNKGFGRFFNVFKRKQ